MVPQEKRRSWKGAAWVVFVNAGLLAGMLTGVEFGARTLIQRSGGTPQPFLFDASAFQRAPYEVRQAGGTAKMSFLDPHLGYAHDHAADRQLGGGHALPGFVVYGDPEAVDAFRIVALGGSTTDPLDAGNWPHQLQRMLAEVNVRAVVYNGGVSGYSTNQELLKLIRDALPLAPDIVICLNGVNDLGFMHSVPTNPMVHPYQKRLLETVSGDRPVAFLPNTRGFLRQWRERNTSELNRISGVNFGPPVEVHPAQQWARNVGYMYALCQWSGVAYVAYLQPMLGIGEYTPGPGDDERVQNALRMYGPGYLSVADEFFDAAGTWAGQTTFAVDLTDVFAGQTGLYRDQRHPNEAGYRRIAQAIRDDLEARKLLPATSE